MQLKIFTCWNNRPLAS